MKYSFGRRGEDTSEGVTQEDIDYTNSLLNSEMQPWHEAMERQELASLRLKVEDQKKLIKSLKKGSK